MDIKDLEQLGLQALDSTVKSHQVDLTGMKIVYVITSTGVDGKIIKIVPTKKRKSPLPKGMAEKAKKIFKHRLDAYYLYILLERAKEYIKKIDFNLLTVEQKALLDVNMLKRLEEKK
jgi:hypothetical protein